MYRIIFCGGKVNFGERVPGCASPARYASHQRRQGLWPDLTKKRREKEKGKVCQREKATSGLDSTTTTY